jgi:hypothetical protein
MDTLSTITCLLSNIGGLVNSVAQVFMNMVAGGLGYINSLIMPFIIEAANISSIIGSVITGVENSISSSINSIVNNLILNKMIVNSIADTAAITALLGSTIGNLVSDAYNNLSASSLLADLNINTLVQAEANTLYEDALLIAQPLLNIPLFPTLSNLLMPILNIPNIDVTLPGFLPKPNC